MASDFRERCEAIEACYEFTLSYAAQGHASDGGSAAGRQLRDHLSHAAGAIGGLEASCAAAAREAGLEPAAACEAYIAVLAADARHALAAIELVRAQPVISSQLMDNLNASIHLRALLTDLFLFAEILDARRAKALTQS